MKFGDLKRQLDWFNQAGVQSFNFSVLDSQKKQMIHHKLMRDADEVMKAAGWAWVKNDEGMEVYLRPAAGIDQPIVFLDDLPAGIAVAVASKYPALVVETSQGNHQVWVQTSISLTISDRANTQQHLAKLIDADPGSTSGDHFGRAACYLNRKPGRNNWPVRVVATTHGQPLNISPHVLLKQNSSKPEAKTKQPHPLPSGRGASASSGVEDESRKEFGWACGWLRAGCGLEMGIQRLTSRALGRGKRLTLEQAREYAEKTFQVASRRI